jgi:hypothetical protein
MRETITATIITQGIKTKGALKRALSTDVRMVEFRSTSAFHQDGATFNLPLAVTAYGPVGVEVTLPNGSIATVHADRHPSGVVGATVI